MEKEKKLYQKWWFWSVIIVAIIIICLVFGRNEETSSSTNDVINNAIEDYDTKVEKKRKEYESNIKVKTNPYEITKQYDGIYKFKISNDNGNGYIYTSIGVIKFNEGVCNLKYEHSNESGEYRWTREYEGFCGINKEDNSTFYFIINDNANYEVKIYKCMPNEVGLICELKSEYDLSGYTNSNLNLEYLINSNDINTTFSQILKEEQERKEQERKVKEEQEKQEFISSCKTYTFEQMARNPDNFKGTNVKITGEVVQALYDTNSVDLRVNITKKGNYSTYYTDTVYVIYTPNIGEDKILEDDIITIYGTSKGDYSYTSTMGSKITLPLIDAKYIVLQK